jgi:hypothetical protein
VLRPPSGSLPDSGPFWIPEGVLASEDLSRFDSRARSRRSQARVFVLFASQSHEAGSPWPNVLRVLRADRRIRESRSPGRRSEAGRLFSTRDAASSTAFIDSAAPLGSRTKRYPAETSTMLALSAKSTAMRFAGFFLLSSQSIKTREMSSSWLTR